MLMPIQAPDAETGPSIPKKGGGRLTEFTIDYHDQGGPSARRSHNQA